jgi:hypothetical protein
VKRRFKLLQHNSQFKDSYSDNIEKLEFKSDKDLSTKLVGEYRNALIHLIASYSKHYWIEKCLKEYPEDWLLESKDNMNDNDGFKDWFYNNFEISPCYQIHKEDFDDIFRRSLLTNLKAKDEVARLKIKCKYDSQMKIGKRKGYWVGFRKIVDDDSEDDNFN